MQDSALFVSQADLVNTSEIVDKANLGERHSICRMHVTTGCSSAWLEHLVWDQDVAGSNPVTPIFALSGQK